jgi:hypothetical protein
MGFGFNLFFIFILLPLTAILLLLWLFRRKKIFGNILGIILLGIVVLIILTRGLQKMFSQKELDKKDYYGQYIVNRNYFPGKQSDWQYNNFRFEIKRNDSIYFYVTDKERILKTFRGTISTVKPFSSQILVISMEQPTNHIVASNPTIYRSAWDFYLVFYSSKFNNVYFKKGEWKPLDK